MTFRIFVIGICCLFMVACSKITQENYNRLKAGQSKTEVEEILGKPADCSGALGLSSCTWGDKNSFISVQYVNDKVVMYAGQGLR
ncbi:hypothetical protein IQ22_02006 [Pseudomonas duriflava]|uniref:Beta-barrel assembly machine subunit BamE n=1 Tax=Pseudomonas duriflava TaxID=459528 RepID=A0A562QBN9_9PSED|nr:hypothetical protein [Pseudomonas duriflava]TWI54144.1 hypothetical protein IQ22_02006 [Pseudomonas duriflava]